MTRELLYPLFRRKKRCNSFTRSQRKNEELAELKASMDSIVSEQERQNRTIDNIKSDVVHFKSLSIQYAPEIQEIKQRDIINELKKVSRQSSVIDFEKYFRITMLGSSK